MPVGPLTKREINPIGLPTGLSLKSGADIHDLKLTSALHKLISDDTLTPQEIEVIKQNFTAAAGKDLIQELRQYLSIKGDNFDDANSFEDLDSFDKNPLQEVKLNDAGSLVQKQNNFREELQAARERLNKLLGGDAKAKNSPIIIEINKVLTAMSGIKNEAGADNFSTQVRQELNSRLQAKASSGKGTEPKTNPETKFSKLTNDELAWVVRGGTAVAAPELTALTKAPAAKKEFKLDEMPASTEVKDWYHFLKAAEQALPAVSKNQARSLLRNLQNLEELKDSRAIKDLMKLKNLPVDDASVEEYKNRFNQAITKLKTAAKTPGFNLNEYDFDSQLHASLEAEATALPDLSTLAPEDYRKFSTALNLLEGNKAFTETNPNITHVITKLQLTDELKDKSPAQKKVFLAKLLNKIKNESQINQANRPGYNPDLDPATADPAVFFDRFKDSIEYLHTHIQAKSENPEEFRRLEQEMVRFMRSGELSDALKKEFKKNPGLAEALNYFTRGRGDSQMNIGLVRSLFNLPYESQGATVETFNIRDIVAICNDMDQVAHAIETGVVMSGLDGNQARIPEELIDQSVKAQTFFNLSPEVFEPELGRPNEKGERTLTGNFALFKKLGIQSYMSGDDDKHKVEIKDGSIVNIPKELRSLINASFGKEMSDSEIVTLLTDKTVADHDAATGKVSFIDNGAVLMTVLKKQILNREESYLEYDSYDPKQTTSYAQLMEARDMLIKLSEEHKLGIFQKSKVPQAFHEAEYREALDNFATNIDYLSEHFKANIKPPEVSSNSTYFGYPKIVDAASPAATTPATVQSDIRSTEQIFHSIERLINGNIVSKDDDYTIWGIGTHASAPKSHQDKLFAKIQAIIDSSGDSFDEDDSNNDNDSLFPGIKDPFTKRYNSFSINS